MAGRTKTTTQAGPPQLMPEGAPGYKVANEFYGGMLANPEVYQGERFAPMTEGQSGAFQQAKSVFGDLGGPQYRQQGTYELGKTIGGDWMYGPAQQAAVESAAVPIFERFENQTMPGIRDRAQFSTGTSGGSRRTVAEHNAVQDLGQSLATGVVAPIYGGERERMTRQAIEGTQGFANQDIARTQAMAGLGEAERKLNDLSVQAARDPWEEQLARRGMAAESLSSMAVSGPGGSNSIYDPSTMRMLLGSGKA